MSKLNIRRVCIKTPSVKNYLKKHQSEQEDSQDIIYIGRAVKTGGYPELSGSPLANPYYINKDGTREEVVRNIERGCGNKFKVVQELKKNLKSY